MLFLKRTMLLLILCAATTFATAQQKIPAFRNYSSSILVSESTLSNTVKMAKGQLAQINFGNELNFSGEVVSNVQVYGNLQTIIIRSKEFNNALLQISKQTLEDNTVSYVGRIFSEGSADGYHIKRGTDGAYNLQKFDATVLKQDCAL